MLDFDIEEVFADLEEKDYREHEFVQVLAAIIPSFVFQLQKRSGAVFPSVPGAAAVIDLADGIFAEIQQQGYLLINGRGGTLCGINVEELEGVLFCWQEQKEEKRTFCDQTIAGLIRAACRYALMQLEFKDVQTENDQLSRQIGVLKKQHLDLVESNHRQYMQIQEKERHYAKNLESEIAARTAELRKVNADLQQASRLKSEFLANMSHELRTPMNAIIGFSDLLTETKLDSEQADFVKTIKNSGDGLLALINDILDFAKIEAGKLDIAQEVFCLPDVVENVRAMFLKPATEKNIHLHYNVDDKIPSEVIGDGNRLKQILVNLTGNAMKFTEQGEVSITVDFIKELDSGCVVRFLVSDTGIGISLEKQAGIFEKFTQADGSISRNYGGTGLGLAISCQLVELMGGNVFLCSAEGEGSIFSFTVQLKIAPSAGEGQEATGKKDVQDTAGASQRKEEPGAEQALADFQVLLVEDNLVNQKLATILIKREGCAVDIAGDGVQALEKLKQGVYDLILMDIQMPNMDGLQATQRIRAIEGSEEKTRYQGLAGEKEPVVIVGLSAHARKEDEEQALEAGMNAFLTKPIVRKDLIVLLDRYKAKE